MRECPVGEGTHERWAWPREGRGSVYTVVLPLLTCFNLCLSTAATILPQQHPGTQSNQIPGSGYETRYGMFFLLVGCSGVLGRGLEGLEGLDTVGGCRGLVPVHVCVYVTLPSAVAGDTHASIRLATARGTLNVWCVKCTV